MTFASKTVTGALAAALLTTAAATPAEARHRGYRHNNNGISLGDIVLGTIAVAGVATAVGALSNGGRYGDRYDRRYGNRGQTGGRSVSVDACGYEAEREAGRRFGGTARVRDIQEVDRDRYGYRVRGTLDVQNRDDDGYGRNDGYGRDRYYDRGSERVAFTCSVENGRVRDLRVGSNYAYGY